MDLYTTRTNCRLCGGPFRDVVSLGDIHLSTFLDTNENPPPKVPIDLVMCESCRLFQLRHTVNPTEMYGNYWYQSGLNDSMVKALGDVVCEVDKRIILDPQDIWVDIGANDGTLLSLVDEGIYRVGFEPSNLWELGYGKCDHIINDYFNARSFRSHLGLEERAKVITAIAMFYDLEEPHAFVEDLKSILADDGIICIQMMDLMSMFKYGDFPNLCHEHLEYYSLEVLCRLMLEHGLQIFDVAYNGVNGGSLRAYISHYGARPVERSVYNALTEEHTFFQSIGDPGAYFKKTIETVKDKVVTAIREAVNQGDRVAVLGASTKGNTILQYFRLTNKDIIHAAEINPDKFGKKTVGSNIPIVQEIYSKAQFPEYYLVLPWGFIDNFVKKNEAYLREGGLFIVPLPQPRIIGWDENQGAMREWPL